MDPYALIAKYYDKVFEPLNRKLFGIGVRMAPPRPGLAVLEVGCGTGTLLVRFADGGCDVTGLDASEAMLAVARKRLGSRADLTLGNAATMPYDDDAFDLVAATMFLHELDPSTREAVMREACRVLRSDGRLLLIDYHVGPFGFPRGWLLRGFNTFVERIAGRAHYDGYRHFVSHGAIPGLARAHDLEVEAKRIVAGGTLGIFVLRPSATA